MAVTEVRGSSTSVAEQPPGAPATRRGWIRSLDLAVPLILIGLIVFACYLLPYLAPIPKPIGGDILDSLAPSFSPGHPLGADFAGNDILSRILYGGRSSLFIALSVQVIGLVLGGTLGGLAAIVGGIGDSLIMRVMDVLIGVPALVLVLVVSQALGPGMRNTIFALSFLQVPVFARIARAETLRLRELPFMVAAKLSGTSMWRVLGRHLAPNIGPALMTAAMLGIGIIIFIEGALTFLGGGIQQPNPSWGNMIFQGQQSLSGTPGLVLWPSIMLVLTVMSFNSLGEALRSRWSGGR
jgi:peptide/nickel transport system permease protein